MNSILRKNDQKPNQGLFKKHRRYRSQDEDVPKALTLQILIPDEPSIQLQFSKGASLSEVKNRLILKFGKGLAFYSIKQDSELDFCLEQELGNITESYSLRYEQLNSKLDESSLEDYKIYKCLSVGGFSKVFLVRSKKSGKFFAAKFIEKDFNSDKKFRQLVENERQINRKLDHPFVVQMHNYIETGQFFVFFLDYCPGGELFGVMKNHRDMTEEEAKVYFIETALAISYMHSLSIIYRDIKPENILIDSRGHVKIADFGLAKVTRTKCNSYCGSLQYMAPQIVVGDQYDFGVDYYCLGSLLFQMMVGCPPFYNPDFAPTETKYHIVNTSVKFPSRKKLSPELKDFVIKLLDKNQNSRLGKIGGMREILSHPWIGYYNKQHYLSYRVPPPFPVQLRSTNFETNYLPLEEIKIVFRKIEKQIHESHQKKKYQVPQNLPCSANMGHQVSMEIKKKRLKNKDLYLETKRKLTPSHYSRAEAPNSQNLNKMFATNQVCTLKCQKRRTKSSEDFYSEASDDHFKSSIKANRSDAYANSSSPYSHQVKCSNLLQKVISLSLFCSRNQSRSASKGKDQSMAASKKIGPVNGNTKARSSFKTQQHPGGLSMKKAVCREGKQNILRQKYENKRTIGRGDRENRISDCNGRLF